MRGFRVQDWMNVFNFFHLSLFVSFHLLFFCTFCSFSSCKFFFLFLAFFLYSFPPTVFFISYIIYIRAVLSYLLYFSLLFPALALSLSLFIFLLSFHVLLSFYPLFVFPFSHFFVCLLFVLLASLASSYDALCLCVFCFWVPYRPRVLLSELEITHIIPNVGTMHSLRVHECERNMAVTTQKHLSSLMKLIIQPLFGICWLIR